MVCTDRSKYIYGGAKVAIVAFRLSVALLRYHGISILFDSLKRVKVGPTFYVLTPLRLFFIGVDQAVRANFAVRGKGDVQLGTEERCGRCSTSPNFTFALSQYPISSGRPGF
jgi:hypothetical protein